MNPPFEVKSPRYWKRIHAPEIDNKSGWILFGGIPIPNDGKCIGCFFADSFDLDQIAIVKARFLEEEAKHGINVEKNRV